jgi:hypothetical protein
LEKLGNFGLGPLQQPPGARTLAVANLQSSPSLLNVGGSEPFSPEDIEVEKVWAEERAKVQRPMDFGNGRQFEDARVNERCCWICENWVQETVSYIPGWSGPEVSIEDVSQVFAYFSIDGFQRPTRLSRTTEKFYERQFVVDAESAPKVRKRGVRNRSGNDINADLVRALPNGDRRKPIIDQQGRYYIFKGSRMLPPSSVPIQICFQVNQSIVCADNLPKEARPEAIRESPRGWKESGGHQCEAAARTRGT